MYEYILYIYICRSTYSSFHFHSALLSGQPVEQNLQLSILLFTH